MREVWPEGVEHANLVEPSRAMATACRTLLQGNFRCLFCGCANKLNVAESSHIVASSILLLVNISSMHCGN